MKFKINLFIISFIMFTLDQLPYQKTALEPYISSRTLDFHYDKHHQGYCNNLNKLITGTEFEGKTIEEIILSTYQNQETVAIYNNAAQVWNHTFYWKSLKKGTSYDDVSEKLKFEIIKKYGNVDNFLEELKNNAISQFGSGWAWVVWNKGRNGGEIDIIKTANALNPMNLGLIPLITMDVWEHAYYLDYQNNRALYIETFLKTLLNWAFLNENFNKAIKSENI